jgi:hypothetical protein
MYFSPRSSSDACFCNGFMCSISVWFQRHMHFSPATAFVFLSPTRSSRTIADAMFALLQKQGCGCSSVPAAAKIFLPLHPDGCGGDEETTNKRGQECNLFSILSSLSRHRACSVCCAHAEKQIAIHPATPDDSFFRETRDNFTTSEQCFPFVCTRSLSRSLASSFFFAIPSPCIHSSTCRRLSRACSLSLSLSLPLSLSPLSRSGCKPRQSSVVGALLRFVGASGSLVAEEGSRLHGRKQNRYHVARDGGGKAPATCLCIIACFATAHTTTTTSSPVCFSACHSSSRDAMDPNQGSFEESRWWWRRRRW